jgi:DNA-binding NtrC family response regulator
VDRGKRTNKGLPERALGLKKIPLVDGNFTDPGQLRRSVRTLLTRAITQDDRNLYVVGVAENLFDAIWDEAAPLAEHREGTRISGEGQADARGSAGGARRPSAQLMDVLPPLGVSEKGKLEELEKQFFGSSPDIRLVREMILRLAPHKTVVMIQGETGTGKEIVARAIHNFSGRPGRFVPINCGAIPSELLESELFGYAKGGHSTAKTDKPGLWEEANHGTLFLDEIGELRPDHQAKVLRALQGGTLRRVGSTKDTQVDARVIAATNRNLRSMVMAEQFREDLYYRLKGWVIYTPPLRSHPEDIPETARSLWRGFEDVQKGAAPELPQEILEELQRYPWRGNVRELKAILRSLHQMFVSGGRRVERLGVEHLRAVLTFLDIAETRLPSGLASRMTQDHLVECLRHLQRVDQAVCACETALRAIAKDEIRGPVAADSTQSALRYHRQELETLCQQRFLFHGEAAYLAVKSLLDTLSSLLQMGGGVGPGVRPYWGPDVDREFGRVLSTLFREFKEVIAKI